jgi:hypothetical protein
MEKKIEKYVLKCNIPGGNKKGDVVQLIEGGWYWETNPETFGRCVFDPTRETEFFAPLVEPMFPNGTVVYFKEKYSPRRDTNINTNKPCVVKSSSMGRYGMVYVLEHFGKIVEKIKEDLLYIPEIYWFINSHAKVCSEVKTLAHMNNFEYKYRLYTNNVFNNIEDARDFIEDCKKGIAEKENIRISSMTWWNGLSSGGRTKMCDLYTELVGSVRRWESLTSSEIQKIYESEKENNMNNIIKTENKKENKKENSPEYKKCILQWDLPGGYKKGDTVILIDGFWFWEAEDMFMLEICDFDPTKSKDFIPLIMEK